jgi:hypothetical protein
LRFTIRFAIISQYFFRLAVVDPKQASFANAAHLPVRILPKDPAYPHHQSRPASRVNSPSWREARQSSCLPGRIYLGGRGVAHRHDQHRNDLMHRKARVGARAKGILQIASRVLGSRCRALVFGLIGKIPFGGPAATKADSGSEDADYLQLEMQPMVNFLGKVVLSAD